MFNNINLNAINSYSNDEICKAVTGFADCLSKNLDLRIENYSLQILGQDRLNTPSLEVLDGLNKVSKVVIEKGLDKILEDKLIVINDLCKQIIANHPCPFPDFPELMLEILSQVNPKKIASLCTVNNFWNEMCPKSQILSINKNQVKFQELFKSAEKAVEWIIKNPSCKFLEYANFWNLELNNECLEKLKTNCPNLKNIITGKDSVWNFLKNTHPIASLKTNLNIFECVDLLEPDELKHSSPIIQLLSSYRRGR